MIACYLILDVYNEEDDELGPVRGSTKYATMQPTPTKLRSRTWTGSESMDAASQIMSSQSIGNLDAMSLSRQINSPPPSVSQSREDMTTPRTKVGLTSQDTTPLHGRHPPIIVPRPQVMPKSAPVYAHNGYSQQQVKPKVQTNNKPAVNSTAGFHPALVAMAVAQRSNPPTPSHVRGADVSSSPVASKPAVVAKYCGTLPPTPVHHISQSVSTTQMSSHSNTLSLTRRPSLTSVLTSSTLTLPNATSTPEMAHRVHASQSSLSNHSSEISPVNWQSTYCMKESCV